MRYHQQALEKPQSGIKRTADQKVWCAALGLGLLYDKGQGVEQDYEEAMRWFQRGEAWRHQGYLRRACWDSYASAKYYTGLCYAEGKFGDADYESAAEYFMEAAEQDEEFVKWLRKDAEGGAPLAQYTLGLCHERGTSVAQDHEEAAKWFLKAAGQGLGMAQYKIGNCYHEGTGLEKDHEEASSGIAKPPSKLENIESPVLRMDDRSQQLNCL